MDEQTSTAYERAVAEGESRLRRSWPALLATGAVGGIDVSVGVLAYFLVDAETHSKPLAALAFSIGFVALTLAHSELFTENFLVPIAAITAKRVGGMSLARLWIATAAMNVLAGWVMMSFIAGGFPGLREVSVDAGQAYDQTGIGWRSFALAVLAGVAITLMTWMQHSSDSIGAHVVAAVIMAFVLGVGSLHHVIIMSLTMFAALIYGAPFGYLNWCADSAWAALGNLAGGIGLVTGLRVLQAGKGVIEEQQRAGEAG